ncbi:MAG: class I SAM-dependent methyltransferase [Methanomicrobiales archaeon]
MPRELTDREYAECFDCFKAHSTEWDALSRWLADELLPTLGHRDRIRVLSVGSGTGDFDLVLMRLLDGAGFGIDYTAVDPNHEHNAVFERRVRESRLSPDRFGILPVPFQPGTAPGTYDLIHFTHCLYYIPNRAEAIQRAREMLAPGGSLLIFHQTALGINEVQRLFMERVKGETREMFSCFDLLAILDRLDIPCTFDLLLSDVDVTDIMDGTPEGEMLLCFFLESGLEGVDPALFAEVIRYVRENSRVEDGRFSLFHPGGIVRIRADASPVPGRKE